MIIFLSILFGVISFIIGAGVTHGYAKHRWASTHISSYETDDSDRRVWATVLWPGYWIFVWPFTKTNETTFSFIEKKAAKQVAKNKVRIADLQATRKQLEISNAEMAQAEVEVEKEMAKL